MKLFHTTKVVHPEQNHSKSETQKRLLNLTRIGWKPALLAQAWTNAECLWVPARLEESMPVRLIDKWSVGETPTGATETLALVRLRKSVHRRVEVPLWRCFPPRVESNCTAVTRCGEQLETKG
jgi:hypothetical protein